MEDRKVILKIEHLCKDFDIKAKSFTGKALKLHALSDISLDIYCLLYTSPSPRDTR